MPDNTLPPLPFSVPPVVGVGNSAAAPVSRGVFEDLLKQSLSKPPESPVVERYEQPATVESEDELTTEEASAVGTHETGQDDTTSADSESTDAPANAPSQDEEERPAEDSSQGDDSVEISTEAAAQQAEVVVEVESAEVVIGESTPLEPEQEESDQQNESAAEAEETPEQASSSESKSSTHDADAEVAKSAAEATSTTGENAAEVAAATAALASKESTTAQADQPQAGASSQAAGEDASVVANASESPAESDRSDEEPSSERRRPAVSNRQAPAAEPTKQVDTAEQAAPTAPVAATTEAAETAAAPSTTVAGELSEAAPAARATNFRTLDAASAKEQPQGTSRVDRARFVQRVSGAVRAAQQREGRIQIRLSPPDLGTLRIDLTVQQGSITATLETETNAARTLLLDNLPALRERLAEQDIRVEKFDVDVRRDGQGSPEQQSPNDRQARQSNPRSRRTDQPSGHEPTNRQAATAESAKTTANSDRLDIQV